MNLYILLLIFILFLGENIIINLGIPTKYVYFFYLSIAAYLLITKYKKCVCSEYTFLKILLVFLSIYSAYQIILVGGEGSKQMTLILCCSPFLFACFPRFSVKTSMLWDKLFKILMIFFIIECSIAILERLFQINFFSWSQDENGLVVIEDFEDIKSFRSCSLLGHSLQNALTVSTIMSFILVSSMKSTYKYALWTLGYMAILCFNTRTSIVGNVLILLAYSLIQVFKGRGGKLSFNISNILKVIPIIALIALLISFGFGARLLELGLVDDQSAQVRINTWIIFSFFDIKDFIFGLTPDKARLILMQSGITKTENFWIDFLLRLGLIVLSIITFFYFVLITRMYKGYKRLSKYLTAATFILLASTNNSLSATWGPLFVYLFSIYSFKWYDKKKRLEIQEEYLKKTLKHQQTL